MSKNNMARGIEDAVLSLTKEEVMERCLAGYQTMEHPEYSPAWEKSKPQDFNLVLEGGGFRGQFTNGVLDFFMDEGIFPTTVIGVSAGALTGANFAAGMRGRTNCLNTKYCDYWRYFSMRALLVKGDVFDVDFTFGKMLKETDPYDFNAQFNSPIKLVTVASNIETGGADYHKMGDIDKEMDYLRASAAMPIVSRVVHVGGKKLLDGGIADSVPIEYSKTLGARKHVVVLTQDATYIKGPNKTMPIPQVLYKKYPKFITAMRDRHIGYNRTYKQLVHMHSDGEIFIIRPQKPVTVGTMENDKRKLYALYLSGYEEAKRNYAALEAYLKEAPI